MLQRVRSQTALQLLGPHALGVPRVDDDPGLADLVATTASIPPPLAPGTPTALAAPPRTPNPVPPSPGHAPAHLAVVLRAGGTMPARNVVTLKACPDGCSSLRKRDGCPERVPKVALAAGPPSRQP